MIAYNKTWLYNLYVQEQVAEARKAGLLNNIEANTIVAQYQAGFYTPNLFIRIGLFLLTVIVTFFSLGFISLALMDMLEKSPEFSSILFGLIIYMALEVILKKKNYYRSGVDDALIWISSGMLFGGTVYAFTESSPLFVSVLAFLFSLLFTARFADRLMALVSFLSLSAILFFACSNTGGIIKAIVPFVLMAAAGTVYILTRFLESNTRFFHYRSCVTMVEIAALMTFYTAGNYYVVRELSNEMFNLNLQPGDSIPYGNLFWTFTVLVPVLFLAYGVKSKNTILIRCGLLTIAAMIATIRYYFHMVPVEIAMTIGGASLVFICILVIRYLKTPKYGFTCLELPGSKNEGVPQVESLVIAETFAENPPVTTGTRFGGGSFGGGGAGSDF